jgi:Spy/CpxP family protein refolding chaperone
MRENAIMELFLSIVLALAFLVTAASSTIAQTPQPEEVQPNTDPAISNEYTSLINKVFAPITNKLKLTNEQQFQIVAIITETEVRADQWVQAIAQIEQQLTEIAFYRPWNEAKLRELTDQQAALLSETIRMRVQAKANIYRLLTPDQRALVEREFRLQNQLEGRF